MNSFLKYIGYIQNVSKGMESSAFQMSHLIVGVFGGLPEQAASLRVTLISYLSCILEVPCGVVGDLIGHARAVGIGCACYSLACILIMFSVVADSSVGSVLFLVFSSISSALGGAVTSGSFQALLQGLIDREAANVGEGKREDFRVRALSLSQKYGAYFASFFPVVTMAVLFLLARLGNGEEFLLLVPATAFLIFSIYFIKVSEEIATVGFSISSFRVLRASWGRYVADVASLKLIFLQAPVHARLKIGLLAVLVFFSSVLMIHVHSYLMISEMRRYEFSKLSFVQLVVVFMMLASFDLAHLVKGWYLPWAAQRLSEFQMLVVSYGSVVLLGVGACGGIWTGHQLTSLIVFVMLFRAALSLGQNVVQSSFLVMLPENKRAGAMSFIQGLVILFYGTYSLYLTAYGLEPPQRILLEVAVIGFACILVVVVMYSYGIFSNSQQWYQQSEVEDW